MLVLALGLTACASGHSAVPPTAPHVFHTARRWVGTHGIEVAVPARWKLGRGVCGTPKANTVLWNEDGILACLTSQPPGLTVVEFSTVLRRQPGWYHRHTTPVTIGGAHALRWNAGTVDGSHEVQLEFPHRHTSVTVLSPERSRLRRILASVRIVRADTNGCPTRPAPKYKLGSRPAAGQLLVPAGAVRAVGCSYHGDWLDQSKTIGAMAARKLARALDAAPSGFSRASGILHSICGSTWRGQFVVAYFEYATRKPVSVTAHLDGCTRLGASNGRWGVRFTKNWVYKLVRDADYAGSFPDPRNVR